MTVLKWVSELVKGFVYGHKSTVYTTNSNYAPSRKRNGNPPITMGSYVEPRLQLVSKRKSIPKSSTGRKPLTGKLYRVKLWYYAPNERLDDNSSVECYGYVYARNVDHAKSVLRRSIYSRGFRYYGSVLSIVGRSARNHTMVVTRDGRSMSLEMLTHGSSEYGLLAYSCCHHCHARNRVFEA